MNQFGTVRLWPQLDAEEVILFEGELEALARSSPAVARSAAPAADASSGGSP